MLAARLVHILCVDLGPPKGLFALSRHADCFVGYRQEVPSNSARRKDKTLFTTSRHDDIGRLVMADSSQPWRSWRIGLLLGFIGLIAFGGPAAHVAIMR